MFNRPVTKERCLFRMALAIAFLIYNYYHPIDIWFNLLWVAFLVYNTVVLVKVLKNGSNPG
jgi:hypothetical protein